MNYGFDWLEAHSGHVWDVCNAPAYKKAHGKIEVQVHNPTQRNDDDDDNGTEQFKTEITVAGREA